MHRRALRLALRSRAIGIVTAPQGTAWQTREPGISAICGRETREVARETREGC